MKLIAMGNADIARGDTVTEDDFLAQLDQD